VDEAAKGFAQVFRRSRVPMCVLDDGGVYRDVNEAALRALERTSEQVLGRRIGFSSDPERQSELDGLWEEFRRAGHLVLEWEFERAGGERVSIDVVVTSNLPERHRHLMISFPQQSQNGRLSPREREIAHLLALGLSGEEIAGRLYLSPETVRTHIRNAMEHLGAHTRAHLVALALDGGLITLDR